MGPLWTVGLQALQTRLDTPAIPWKALVNALLWGVYVFETYVSWRQYRMYSRTAPPPALTWPASAGGGPRQRGRFPQEPAVWARQDALFDGV